jgi:hypothetical protein
VQIARSRENAVMQGPMRWWDQPPDSRDNTVSMPRVDPAEFADRQNSARPAAPDGRWAVPERPALGDPYALPALPEQPPRSAQPPQSVPDFEPAAPSDPEAAAAPEPDAAAPQAVETAAAPVPEAPESERVAPAAAQDAAEGQWRDRQSGHLAPHASRAPSPARQPPSQAATETPIGAPPAPAGPADRPPAGSIADLRARLARLPAGHPASPYDDTGRPKAAPIRLRMLELGLPARPAAVASYADPPGFDHDDEADDLPLDGAAAPVGPATAARRASDTEHSSAAERNGTTQPTASEPSRAGTASSAATASSAGPAADTTTASSADTAGGAGSVDGTATRDSAGTAGGAEPAGGADTPRDAGSGTGLLPKADDVAPPHPAASSEDPSREARPRRAEGTRTTERRAGGARDGDRRDRSATSQQPASGQNGFRGRGAQADWQRPYDVAGESDHRSEGQAPLDRADLTSGSWPAIDVSPGAGDHRNGNRADEFRDSTPPGSARGEVRRSQPRPADPDQPTARPPAGQRLSGQVAASRLSPVQRELVDRILTTCRAAEGRNAVGGYGSSGLTPAMMRIAAQLPLGGLAPGSEADTLKAADRLAAKLARLLARQPGRSAEQVAASIGDAIRYAFAFDTASYTESTLLVHRKLKTQGFELEARRNRWDSPEYKGVFTRWRDPAHGLPFEVQFHTGESWAFVQRTHETYVRITDPATSPTERARLRAQQATAAEAVQEPPGCREIADFRAGPREQPR